MKEVLGMFNKGKLDIQDNPLAIEKIEVLKQLERKGYITFFHTEESNIPIAALLTDLGRKIILKN